MASMITTIMRHALTTIMGYTLSVARFTVVCGLLLKNKHTYSVIGDIINNQYTLQVYYNDGLIHDFIYLHLGHGGDWSLPQYFSIFNNTCEAIVETKLEVFLYGSSLECIPLQCITTVKLLVRKTIIF